MSNSKDTGYQLILASGSPRRRELLDQVNLKYQVVRADVDETAYANESADQYVSRIALRKAQRVAGDPDCQLPVLAADTAVILDGEILGKPGNPGSARQMLEGLSGRTHEVFSAVVLVHVNGEEYRRLSVSCVTMAAMEPAWLDAYCRLAEPLDKAGAYAIQGLAAQWITRLEGSYSGVMGLPLFETMELLREAGLETLPPLNMT
jgi:septum formation protein